MASSLFDKIWAAHEVAPGLIYMLCGATQRSYTDPFDTTSPAIPIGPHWMEWSGNRRTLCACRFGSGSRTRRR